ncbi:unnamed protein product [Linum tenue]|uniref:Uncharacterized protein n=1 Tax=Linum tenue TaxID=586396 RepID=A0AAV0GY24_9ROSI|nr:unnamed protein product [Linum tenue]
MAPALICILQNVWPFSTLKSDDLRASDALVNKLPIPESTKRFVYAVHDRKSGSVIYILSVQNLSERSAVDVECLIREVRPEAVVAQVGNSAVLEDLVEENRLAGDGCNLVPTSLFGVLKQCFVHKINKEKYESLAGNLVLKEIFGVGFHGHIWAANQTALEVGSSFLLLEAPCIRTLNGDNNDVATKEVEEVSKFEGLVSSLIPQKPASVVNSTAFSLSDKFQSKMVKLLPSKKGVSPSEAGLSGIKLENTFQVPPFAQSIYPLLVDLHNIFMDLPSMGTALNCSQKMLYDISRGESMGMRVVSEVSTFRVAVEGLRIALNNAGRLPIRKLWQPTQTSVDFSELPVEQKSHALLAHALQNQSEKYKTIVAVVDASSLAGLRTHWNTHVPPNIKGLIGELITDCKTHGESSNQRDKRWPFSGTPVVSVGAGATAVVGASSLSKVITLSTLSKVLTFKLPTSLKLMVSQANKVMAFALTKSGPTKFAAPGLANYSANATSVMKSAASAEKIRTVAHSMIASVEKTSFSAMRTAFYEIMRKRQVRPVGFLPWATFGGSVMTLSGLLLCGDGIECVAESFPSAHSIASLGRGIRSLRLASEEVRQNDCRIQQSIDSLTYRLKKVTIQ